MHEGADGSLSFPEPRRRVRRAVIGLAAGALLGPAAVWGVAKAEQSSRWTELDVYAGQLAGRTGTTVGARIPPCAGSDGGAAVVLTIQAPDLPSLDAAADDFRAELERDGWALENGVSQSGTQRGTRMLGSLPLTVVIENRYSSSTERSVRLSADLDRCLLGS